MICVFLILNVRLFAEDTNQWNVQVLRLQILAPVMESDTNLSTKHVQRLVNFQANNDVVPGVAVSLRMNSPEGQIVGCDDSDSSLDSFTDNTGKNLLIKVPHGYYPESEYQIYGIYGKSWTIGRASLSVGIRAPGLPSKDATRLNIAGKISVQTATGSEQLVAENAKLKTGAEFNLGDMKLTVSDVEFMGKEFFVMLESKQDLSSISTYKFFDRWDREIKCDEQGGPNYSKDEGLSVCDFEFNKRVDNVKIIAMRWIGFKSTEVPIVIKTGLGLE